MYPLDELAAALVKGETYRMTITDCCVSSVRFQGVFLGEKDDLFLFRSPDGTEVRLYDWALPGNLERAT